MQKRTLAATATAIAAGLGLTLVTVTPAGGRDARAEAQLYGPHGTRAATVTFRSEDHYTQVRLRLRQVPTASTALNAFHGFHIHANNAPENGNGCLASGDNPALWFVSADGHWNTTGENHGHHTGDLPSVLIREDGTAELRFTTTRFTLDELEGKAVVLHARPDNFANIPLGSEVDRYTPNGAEATTRTEGTGNAGDRIACGVITR